MPNIDPDQIPTLDDVVEQDDVPEHASEDTSEYISEDITEDYSEQSSDEHPEHDTQLLSDDDQQGTTSDSDAGSQSQESEEMAEQHAPSLPDPIGISFQQPYMSVGNSLATRHDQVDESDTMAADSENIDQAVIDQAMIDDIIESTVKGMLPDLELQLRFLIERALREKLGLDASSSAADETPD